MDTNTTDIEELGRRLRDIFPLLHVQQVAYKKWPSDDDGVWYFYLPDVNDHVTVDAANGNRPFLISCGMKLSPAMYSFDVDSIDRAVDVIRGALCAHVSSSLQEKKE